MPDFFIVGHAKCGTTALYEILRRQPGIHMPVKEPRFFAPVKRREEPARSSEPDNDLRDYLSLFAEATPGQLVGEASPQYLLSHTAAARIAELQPSARIIVLLREPAEFLRSLHLQFMTDYVESEKDFRKAMELEPLRREGKALPRNSLGDPKGLLYSERVRYVEQLRRYRDVFPSEQVLVLIYEDFRADNEAGVRQVLRFLGLDDTAPIELTEANPTIRLRSRKIDELIRSVSLGRGPAGRTVKAAIKAIAPAKLRRDAFQATQRHLAYGKPAPPDQQLMLELRRRFKGEVVAVSEYLGRDLVEFWGYDGLG